MKKVIMMLMGAVVLGACSTLTSAQKAERQAKIAQQVDRMLTDRHYTVNVEMMYPRAGSAVNVTSNYSLEVRGDTLVSYLPYFGRAYNIPYGGGQGLNFTAPIKDYKAVKNLKGTTHITIHTDNGEDDLKYELEVFDNGSTTIDLMSREREPISYSGNLDMDD
ncbi:MAG: DUF4251 domain-containing protein [Prevotella sp.]|nr:DUF4251 domain-containing protein [Prevotella sp.]